MGFRSTLITEDNCLEIQPWFYEKHKDRLHFGQHQDKPSLPLASKYEFKTYFEWWSDELLPDIQRLIKENTHYKVEEIEMVLFHECCGITKVIVSEKEIKYLEPHIWEAVDDVTHNYCYGCSEETKDSAS